MRLVKEDEIKNAKIKALVYGRPGTGKTNFGASGKRPLVLLSEGQAVANVRDAARRMKRPCPAILVMDTIDDYRHVLKALHGDRSKPFVVSGDNGAVLLQMDVWPDEVVIDSITDVMDKIVAEIREQSPPKEGKDGLPVDSERFWNVLGDRGAKFIRAFRDVDLHVVFLALYAEREVGEDDNKVTVVGPQMPMRKLDSALMAAVNVVGVTYRKRNTDAKTREEQPFVYGIATIGPDNMALKPYPPLRNFEVTDFSSWIARINGQPDASVPPPPMEGAGGAGLVAGDVTANPVAAQGATSSPQAAEQQAAEAKAEPAVAATSEPAAPDTATPEPVPHENANPAASAADAPTKQRKR